MYINDSDIFAWSGPSESEKKKGERRSSTLIGKTNGRSSIGKRRPSYRK